MKAKSKTFLGSEENFQYGRYKKMMKTTEMRILRMICGKTLKDIINNEKIREMTGVEKLEEFLREQRLRWMGHVERMDEERGPVKALHLEVYW